MALHGYESMHGYEEPGKCLTNKISSSILSPQRTWNPMTGLGASASSFKRLSMMSFTQGWKTQACRQTSISFHSRNTIVPHTRDL